MAHRIVSRITGFVLAVRDPAASARFYCEGLGFEDAPSNGEERLVRLGGVEVRLVRSSPHAMPPPPESANASDFQHFAMRVQNMAAAFKQVCGLAPTPISHGGPQRLPPTDGSVSAWKFRDPDGHPLELLQFPHMARGGELFEAIDHTAIACSDVAASLAFYEGLGLSQGPSSHNQGVGQDRLDGLAAVDLRISTVRTAKGGPHIELLQYLRPSPRPLRSARRASYPFIKTQMKFSGSPLELRDPDGHPLDLR